MHVVVHHDDVKGTRGERIHRGLSGQIDKMQCNISLGFFTKSISCLAILIQYKTNASHFLGSRGTITAWMRAFRARHSAPSTVPWAFGAQHKSSSGRRVLGPVRRRRGDFFRNTQHQRMLESEMAKAEFVSPISPLRRFLFTAWWCVCDWLGHTMP
jgi:hypothetical protein